MTISHIENNIKTVSMEALFVTISIQIIYDKVRLNSQAIFENQITIT